MSADYRAIAAAIADELTEHPERWCQVATYLDANGRRCTPQRAARACLLGHIWKRSNDDRIDDAFRRVLQGGCFAFASLSIFNDAPNRTVREIIDLCRKVALS
jgi:hypothetical protein